MVLTQSSSPMPLVRQPMISDRMVISATNRPPMSAAGSILLSKRFCRLLERKPLIVNRLLLYYSEIVLESWPLMRDHK